METGDQKTCRGVTGNTGDQPTGRTQLGRRYQQMLGHQRRDDGAEIGPGKGADGAGNKYNSVNENDEQFGAELLREPMRGAA